MTENWEACFVSDIASPTKNALVGGPFGSNLVSKDYVVTGIPVIRGQNMGERWISGDFVFVSEEKAKQLSPNTARPGDLIFTQRGTLGQVAIVPEKLYDAFIISQSQMKLTVNKEKADTLFMYYVFKSPVQQDYILRNAIQTGVPHTNLEHLRTTPVLLPPLPEQRSIAGVLGALDDKIELNRCMNRTLESMARAVFRQWFVENDDVEDWEVGTLGDVVINFDSKRVPLSKREREQRQGKYPYYGAASIMDYVDDYLFDGIYVLMAEDGSVVGDEDHPVLQYVWGKFWVNNHAHVLQGTNGICNEHLYLFLKDVNILPYVTGAVQPKLNQANMNSIPFVIPPKELSKKFEKFVSPLFSRIRANEEESRTLTSLRDSLLPKLMRGEVHVKDVEKEL